VVREPLLQFTYYINGWIFAKLDHSITLNLKRLENQVYSVLCPSAITVLPIVADIPLNLNFVDATLPSWNPGLSSLAPKLQPDRLTYRHKVSRRPFLGITFS
jgi:hypothetical protein